jgi:hypothetical protein
MVIVSLPGLPIIVLGYRVGHIQTLDGVFQVAQLAFILKFWVMVADDDQPLIFIILVPTA